jgi:intracellular sulfur oxidation DsrE/DsrF family protein
MKHLLLSIVVLAIGFVAAQQGSSSESLHAPADGDELRVVVHVNFSDADAQSRALENIENVLKEAGEQATVEVVCHGPGIGLLVKDRTQHGDKVRDIMERNVRFAACRNTMRKQSLTADDLVAGATTVASGTVEVIRKQQQGYAYFKP